MILLCLFSLIQQLDAQPLDRSQKSMTSGLSVRGDREQLSPGLSWGTIDFRNSDLRFEAKELTIDSRSFLGSPQIVIPEKGFWSAQELDVFAKDLNASVVISLLPEDGFLDVPTDDHGFLFHEGRIWSWPPIDQVAAIDSHGSFRIVDSDAFEQANIKLPKDVSVPIQGLNVRPDQEGVYILSGRTLQRPSVQSWFDRDTTVIPLSPVEKNDAPHQSLWSTFEFPTLPFFKLQKEKSFSTLSLSSDEYALVLNSKEEHKRFEDLDSDAILSLHFPLPDEIVLARYAFEVGKIVSKDGVAQEPLTEVPTFMVIENQNQKVQFLDFDIPSKVSLDRWKKSITEYFSNKKNTTILQFNRPKQKLLQASSADSSDRNIANQRTHAVMILPEKSQSTLMAANERVSLLEVLGSESSNQLGTGSPASGLFDGLLEVNQRLDSFWASPLSPSPSVLSLSRDEKIQAWVEVRFADPSVVSAIDFHHAKNSGFDSQFNLKTFRILGRTSNSDRWEELMFVSHEAPVGNERHLIFDDAAYGYLRLEVMEANFQKTPAVARLSEWTIWGHPDVNDRDDRFVDRP